MNGSIQKTVQKIDWLAVETSLYDSGYALTGPLLSPEECQSLAALFAQENNFRSHVVMERYRFGKGDYKYLRYPLPESVQALRTGTYPYLAKIANDWNAQPKSSEKPFPLEHKTFLDRCHRAGQKQPTALILYYEAGGYNCLHQDLYGEISFPLQLVVMLGQQGRDWDGGEFVLVENVPRAQSRRSHHRRSRSRRHFHNALSPGQRRERNLPRVAASRRQPRSAWHPLYTRHHLSRRKITPGTKKAANILGGFRLPISVLAF